MRRESGGGQALVTTPLSPHRISSALILRSGRGERGGVAEGCWEPEFPSLRTQPPSAWEELTPWALSQPGVGCARTRAGAQRARLICRQEEKLIRSPAGMITWGGELPAGDRSSGSSRWRETPASRHRELSGGDREEARKVGMAKGGRDSQTQEQRQPFVRSHRAHIHVLLQTQELLLP